MQDLSFFLSICYSICRVFTAQRVGLPQNLVQKEPTAHDQLSVMSLSAPHVVEAGIVLVWGSQSLLEAAKSASTAEREPSLQYEFFFK